MSKNEKTSNIKVFTVHTPSEEDLQKANKIPANACPRRYCWWWQTLSFDWEIPVIEGCTFLAQKKHPEWKHSNIPCSRCNQSSTIDHYESRDPHLIEDGFETNHFYPD